MGIDKSEYPPFSLAGSHDKLKFQQATQLQYRHWLCSLGAISTDDPAPFFASIGSYTAIISILIAVHETMKFVDAKILALARSQHIQYHNG
jgi:hypothetical protein